MEYVKKFLVSRKWWEVYVNPQSNSVPAVDNRQLIENNSNTSSLCKIKPNITDSEYNVIEPDEWRLIKEKFGGGPELEIFVFNGIEDLHPILIDVWSIHETLATEPDATFAVSRYLTVAILKSYLCEKLSIDSNRYEFFIIKKHQNTPILKELKGLESLPIEDTKIVKYQNVCLKFEDLNWDFSKNDEVDYSHQPYRSVFTQRHIILEKIENVKCSRRYQLRQKKLKDISKNLCTLLAELKLD